MNTDKGFDLSGNKTEILIRNYGLLDPLDWGPDCDNELARMDDLWNNLVDIHENYIDLYYLQIAKDDSLSACKIDYEKLVQDGATSAAISAAKKKLAIRQREVSRAMAPELRALELARRTEVKAARQNSGLWWGNYNALVRAFESARSAAIRSGNSIRRRAVGGNGRLTNTLQGGAAVEHLFDGSLSQVLIIQPPEDAWSVSSRGERRRLQRTTLTVTVFVRSGERRNVSWPMIMHRPIPSDALVKNVVVTRRKINNRWKWAASFTCTRVLRETRQSAAVARHVAVDVGWRRVPEGLRIASVLTADGNVRFINLSQDILSSFELVDELRERAATSARTGIELIQNLDPKFFDEPYRGLLVALQTAEEKKFSHLNRFCASEFFTMQPADIVGSELCSWRSKHIRLLTWLANQQRKVVARRNHFYQNAANEILEGVSVIIVNDIKIGEILRRHRLRSTENFFPRRAQYFRVIAAPSKFIEILKFQAAKRHIEFGKKEVVSPIPCPRCGSSTRNSRVDALPQVCGNCGISFDQDVAACQLLLSSADQVCVARTLIGS